MSTNHLVNPALIAMALEAVARPGGTFKNAFSPMDAVTGGGSGGGVDPNAGAGGGGDMGGGGGGGGSDPGAIAQGVAQAIQPMLQQNMGGGQGGMEPIKPKIDVNVTMLQILKILAKIADALKIPIPAQDMVATQGDLTQFGMQQQQGQDMPQMGAGGAQGQGQSSIAPISPIQPAAPGMGGGAAGGGGGGQAAGKMAGDHYFNNGSAFDTGGFAELNTRAAAIALARSAAARRPN